MKSINGRPVNGKQLFDIFESCVNVFQSGQLPEAKTAVQVSTVFTVFFTTYTINTHL